MQHDVTSSSTSPNTRIYAIGDIHGCNDLLGNLLTWIEDDVCTKGAARNVMVFLGDYVDRGPDIIGVLDRLIKGLPFVQETIFLRGNHEDTLLRFLDGDDLDWRWFEHGGIETFKSYGLDIPDDPHQAHAKAALLRKKLKLAFPPNHKRFLEQLDNYWLDGDYLFVHAGIKPGASIEVQSQRDLLWIRDEFLASTADFGKIIVHGHSITDKPNVQPNRIGIDTGAWRTGLLTCLVLDGVERHFVFSNPDSTSA
ncbi:MAG: serine/threonine protein phosphatase [Rhodospirillales bacterium]|jgi:serine/threonine protein phosphatase 1|nr:serine/threonine protein phosphatase [Rhodospirillales bacterium]